MSRNTNLKVRLVAFSSAVLLFIVPVLAGEPTVTWEKVYGGSSSDEGRAVIQTSDGGYAATGYTRSYALTQKDIWLIKTDPNGNLDWQRSFDNLHEEVGECVRQTSDSGFIIVGTSENYAVDSSIVLVKTDSGGNLDWQTTFGTPNYYDGAKCVLQTSDGGYIIAGYTLNFDVDAGGAHVIKTNSLGELSWERMYYGDNLAQGRSIGETSDGGYIIAGQTRTSNVANSDVYLVKTDSNGNMQWDATFGGGNTDSAYSVQQSDDGGYIIAGYTYHSGSNSSFYLIKTDPNGNAEWEETFGDNWHDFAKSVQQTADGGYIVAGSRDLSSIDRRFCLLKTNWAGNLEWEKILMGSEDVWSSWGYKASITSDGGYIMAGRVKLKTIAPTFFALVKIGPDGAGPLYFDSDRDIDVGDVGVFASAWNTQPGDLNWNPACDIWYPHDNIIDGLDLGVLLRDWMLGTGP